MRKVQGQPNEFGIFVKADAPTPAPAPAPAPVVEEPAAEEAPADEVEEVEGSEDTGWTRSKKRKSK